MGASNYKIGQVASQVGISVRTLRHYDEIGLLKPTSRAATGHRLYTESDIARLKKIVALRKMGFSLGHIRSVLSGDTTEAFKTLEGQASRLREQISQQQDVLKRVEGALDFRETLRRFTKAQTDDVKKRSMEIRTALFSEMERGTDPKSSRVQELVQQMEHVGKELLEYFGGRGTFAERMEFFKNNRDLIPQGDQRQLDAMRERMKSSKMGELLEYLKRAKA